MDVAVAIADVDCTAAASPWHTTDLAQLASRLMRYNGRNCIQALLERLSAAHCSDTRPWTSIENLHVLSLETDDALVPC